MKSKILLITASVIATALPIHAQILSNGTGDWTTGGTWALGNVPTTAQAFTIQAPDTVTANSAGLIQENTINSFVYGTLNVGTGTTLTMGRLNSGVVSSGIVNINGGNMTVVRLADGTTTGSANVVNISSGNFTVQGNAVSTTSVTLNVSGGVYDVNNSTFGTLNLSGSGKMIVRQGGFGGLLPSWAGGTIQVQTGTLGSTATNALFNPWKSNDANRLDLSFTTTKQTLTLGTGVNSTMGTLGFNIYGFTNNDSDRLAMTSTHALTLSSGVDLSITGLSLAGTTTDYIGKSFQLFSVNSGIYTNINPTIAPSVFTIGGTDYDVVWGNTLNSNGSLTINSLSVIPEPGTLALVGIALGSLLLFRRRK
jgi:hypothetical protein